MTWGQKGCLISRQKEDNAVLPYSFLSLFHMPLQERIVPDCFRGLKSMSASGEIPTSPSTA